MDERELNRAIDAAADTMMAREPSRSLSGTVMARVREDAPSLPRRFVWMTAIASLMVCAAIAITSMHRTSTAVIRLPPAPQLAIAQSAVARDVPVTITMETTSMRRGLTRFRGAISIRSRMPLLPTDVSAIEPIQLSVIDVPGLAHEATSIDTLNIEPLTIEPLAASND